MSSPSYQHSTLMQYKDATAIQYPDLTLFTAGRSLVYHYSFNMINNSSSSGSSSNSSRNYSMQYL